VWANLIVCVYQPVLKQPFLRHYSDTQSALLQNALSVVNRLPPSLHDRQDDGSTSSLNDLEEQGFKNMWNFNLPDAAFGWVILDVHQGRVSAETKAQGFNFSYRKSSGYPGSSTASSQKAHSIASSDHSAHEPDNRVREAPLDGWLKFLEYCESLISESKCFLISIR
jgi:hypothetical protein